MTTGDTPRLKIGMLGVGAAAQWYYLPATKLWSDRLDLKAVCDLDIDRARHFGELYGADAVFTDYEQMLSNADINAVAILTPHERHAEEVLLAIEHGKHVLIEKPMAGSLADAEAICEAAEAQGIQVSCAPPNMLHPGQRRLMQLVSSGAIGEVSLVRNTRSSMGPGSRPGAPTDFSWFYQSGAGGMSSMAGYGLIKMTAVLGPVKSLSAMSCISMPERIMRDGPAKGKVVQVDVPDNNVMVLDFGNNTLGTMDTGYVMMASEAPDMELFGTEGTLSTYGGDQVEKIRLYKDDWKTDVAGWQDVDIPNLESRMSKHPSTLLSLADAVLDGKPLVNGPRHMVHVVEVIEKTWLAAKTRQTVDLTTTFPMVSWEDLPFETSTAKLV
ncbi:MAG: Gfo/Idh/MocA family oxidoreductase [SAR202 cluster bacterium]|jgi:predicted dehydrogenase|nr:Gfo/Idh/MocA family oxidoreductase [SAR202 cluster bacterium]MDP6513653.1 Gfo/Idh/MocA family oxidoreductase [SAR202 cluster bacterium]MDP6716670.1 Gfo/Idh/MocA family oxidoreductase [SAR202 cluster bacterium]